MKKYGIFAFIFVVGLSQSVFCMKPSDEEAAHDEEDTSSSSEELAENLLVALSKDITTLHGLCGGLQNEVAAQEVLLGDLEAGVASAQETVAAAQERTRYSRDELLRLRPVTLLMVRERLSCLVHQSRLSFEDLGVWTFYWDKLVEFNRVRVTSDEEFPEETKVEIRNYIRILQRLAETASITDFNADKIYDLVIAARFVRALSRPLTIVIPADVIPAEEK